MMNKTSMGGQLHYTGVGGASEFEEMQLINFICTKNSQAVKLTCECDLELAVGLSEST